MVVHGSSLATLEGPLLILPESLKSLNESLKKHYTAETTAQLLIKKKFIQRLDPDEYIEDEHLYSATGEVSYEESLCATLSVVSYQGFNVLVVPNFDADKVNYNLVARLLLKEVVVPLITITPGPTPHDQLVCTLGSSWGLSYTELPPPFVITGISGALVSGAGAAKREVIALVLQSEGVPGFEKVNERSIGEVARVLREKLSLYDKFVENVEKSLHYGKSVNSLGLYI